MSLLSALCLLFEQMNKVKYQNQVDYKNLA